MNWLKYQTNEARRARENLPPGSDVLALFFERVLQAFLKFLKIKKISYSIFYG